MKQTKKIFHSQQSKILMNPLLYLVLLPELFISVSKCKISCSRTDYVPANASTQVNNRREFLRSKLFGYCEVFLFQCSVSSSSLRNFEILKGMTKTIIHKCWIISRNNCLKYPRLTTPFAGNVIFNKTKELYTVHNVVLKSLISVRNQFWPQF